MDKPVNGGDDGALSERSVIQLVDSPNCMAGFLLIIPWYIERIVEGSDEEKEPGESTEELVSPNGLDCMRLASCKRVHYSSCQYSFKPGTSRMFGETYSCFRPFWWINIKLLIEFVAR